MICYAVLDGMHAYWVLTQQMVLLEIVTNAELVAVMGCELWKMFFTGFNTYTTCVHPITRTYFSKVLGNDIKFRAGIQ